MSKKLTQEEFIAKCNEVHGFKYDYSKFEYHGPAIKSIIICPIHNLEFSPRAVRHLKGSGCPTCARENLSKNTSLETFVARATKIHKGTYDYSKVIYKNTKTKVIIVCPIHGEFSQTPMGHVNEACGCPECKRAKATTSLEDRIAASNIVHEFKFDYSLINKETYKKARNKVPIVCPSHGVFMQSFDHHILSRAGCPFCKSSRGEEKVAGYLNSKNIEYKREKKFKDCINLKTGRKLKCDFYIPKMNVIIEYNGSQHYLPRSFGSDQSPEAMQKKLEYTQASDQLKADYALKNNIKLIVIPYTRINSIPEILDRELFGINQDTISYDSTQAVQQAA